MFCDHKLRGKTTNEGEKTQMKKNYFEKNPQMKKKPTNEEKPQTKKCFVEEKPQMKKRT